MTARFAFQLVRPGLLAMGLLAASPAFAEAQVRAPVSGPKWEFEVHGAFATPTSAPSGLTFVPGTGPSFTLGDGTTPSQAVTSWYFGHGATFLNQVLGLRGVKEQLTALDANGWPSAGRRAGAQVGARIDGRITNTVWFEVTADFGLDPIGFDGAAKSEIEDTRASFINAFTALNNSTLTLTGNPTVTSTATVTSGGRRLVTSGVVQYRGKGPGTRPYVLAGVGFAAPIGGATSLELAGRYQLATPSGAKFDETDTVVLEYRSSASFVFVTGAGFMRDLSKRAGYRVDVRVMFGRTDMEARLSTDPTVSVTTPTGAAILNSTSPGLQFATNGLRTNLSGPAIHDFVALTSSEQRFQWVISAGYFRRF